MMWIARLHTSICLLLPSNSVFLMVTCFGLKLVAEHKMARFSVAAHHRKAKFVVVLLSAAML